MPLDSGFKVVTIDAGNGPVKAVLDSGNRVITAPELDKIRQRHEADLAQFSDLRHRLSTGDASATADIVSQAKSNITQRLAALDKQRSDMAAMLDKLNQGDNQATNQVVTRAIAQLDDRLAMVTAARAQIVAMLGEIAPAPAPPVLPVPSPVTIAPITATVEATALPTPTTTPVAIPVTATTEVPAQ